MCLSTKKETTYQEDFFFLKKAQKIIILTMVHYKTKFLLNCFHFWLLLPVFLFISTVWLKHSVLKNICEDVIQINKSTVDVTTKVSTETLQPTVSKEVSFKSTIASTFTSPITVTTTQIAKPTVATVPQAYLQETIWLQINSAVKKVNTDLLQHQYVPHINSLIMAKSALYNQTTEEFELVLNNIQKNISDMLANTSAEIAHTVETLSNEGTLLSSGNNENLSLDSLKIKADMFDSMFQSQKTFLSREQSRLLNFNMTNFKQGKNSSTIPKFALNTTQTNLLNDIVNNYVCNNTFHFTKDEQVSSENLKRELHTLDVSQNTTKNIYSMSKSVESSQRYCVALTVIFVTVFIVIIIISNYMKWRNIQTNEQNHFTAVLNQTPKKEKCSVNTFNMHYKLSNANKLKTKSFTWHILNMISLCKGLIHTLFILITEYMLVIGENNMGFLKTVSSDNTPASTFTGINTLNVEKKTLVQKSFNTTSTAQSLGELNSNLNQNFNPFVYYNSWDTEHNNNTIMTAYFTSIGALNVTQALLEYRNELAGDRNYLGIPAINIVFDSDTIIDNTIKKNGTIFKRHQLALKDPYSNYDTVNMKISWYSDLRSQIQNCLLMLIFTTSLMLLISFIVYFVDHIYVTKL